MQCPICRQRTMYVVEHDNIELDVCARCEGLWFDAGELDLLLGGEAQLDDLPPGEAPAEDARKCPRCRKTLAKANIGPGRRVVVDVCKANDCGLWFDRGELRDLCRDLADTGWQVAPEVREFLSSVFPETPAGG